MTLPPWHDPSIPRGFALPVEATARGIVFTGTIIPVELFLSYVIGHGPRGSDALRDFLRDFPQIPVAQVWAFIELVQTWSTEHQ